MRGDIRSVLFIGAGIEDYLADGLLMGLKALLEGAVVDVPKPDYLYESFPAEFRPRLYGRGFSLYCRLREYPTYRARSDERLERGEFDLVVFGGVHRLAHELLRLRRRIPARTRVALLDGEDAPNLFPRAQQLAQHPELALLRFDPSWLYFKREWDDAWPTLARDKVMHHLPSSPPAHRIRHASFGIPPDVILDEAEWDAPRPQQFPAHIVDAEVAEALGKATKYAFDSERDYHDDLARSRFGITTKRAGWDCLRHYEIAARGAIPCFRDLDRKPTRCAPHGLDSTNSISYRDHADLRSKIASLAPQQESALRRGALRWAQANTTTNRAVELLDAFETDVTSKSPNEGAG